MKGIVLLGIVLILIFILIRCDNYSGPDPVDKFVAKIAKDLAKKYHLESGGIGGGATDEGVWLVSIRFSMNGKPLEFSEGRKLIIKISEEFLKAFNENRDIRPFLKVHPFTSKNISIAIFMHDLEGNDVFDPYLDIVSVSNGELEYFTRDSINILSFKTIIEEPYVEAFEKVKAESQNFQH